MWRLVYGTSNCMQNGFWNSHFYLNHVILIKTQLLCHLHIWTSSCEMAFDIYAENWDKQAQYFPFVKHGNCLLLKCSFSSSKMHLVLKLKKAIFYSKSSTSSHIWEKKNMLPLYLCSLTKVAIINIKILRSMINFYWIYFPELIGVATKNTPILQ